MFGDLTFEEFVATSLGLGRFSSAPAAVAPAFATRGQLPVNRSPPRAVDTEQGCQTPVKDQLCNSCSAHSVVAASELCLCRAGGEVVTSRSVQQASECSDGTGLDIGSQVNLSSVEIENIPPVVVVRSRDGTPTAWSVSPTFS